ncbi:MAG: hypothetical protein AB7T14_04875 [Candidatus Methylacidiphilaceae bacterium]
MNGDGHRTSRLLRGWVQCLPYWEGDRAEEEFGRRAADPEERAIEESASLREEIERAQQEIRELAGVEGEVRSWSFEQSKQPASENVRLWRAVAHLAEALDLISERLEILEQRRRRVRRR